MDETIHQRHGLQHVPRKIPMVFRRKTERFRYKKVSFKSTFHSLKLSTVNCIDRHARVNPDKVALIWEKDEPGQEVKISYKELSAMTNKLANLLKSQGIKKGDIVAIYMPMSPMAVAAMLACTRIGNVHLSF